MARMITCECGYQARGADDDELLASIMSHIASVHPERVGAFSATDLLSMAVSVGD
jgi:predicted small metal-binding protein